MRPPVANGQRGFTLVELVMVIAVLGVVGAVVAVFMRSPIEAYFASARRAALTDAADHALRRLSRDLRTALPNSVRTPSPQCLEFIPTKTGGRYRAQDLAAGDGSALDFTTSDTRFHMLADQADRPATQRIATGDVVVVYNLGQTGSDAYNGDNTANVSATPSVTGSPGETVIAIGATRFPYTSPSQRFHVVPAEEKVVTYVCSGGQLRRTANAVDFTSACPASGPVLADNATCDFDYTGPDLQRNGLLRLVLRLSQGDESVQLHHFAQVSNTP
jgi:MSHA biogenesis protein MshO